MLAVVAGISRISLTNNVAPISLQLANAVIQGRRHASVKAQGAYKKKCKRGIPNKLGAKRTGGTWSIDVEAPHSYLPRHKDDVEVWA